MNSLKSTLLKKFPRLLFTIAFLPLTLFSQQLFNVTLKTSSLKNIPAIHSFAFASWQGKWIFVGGRTNGLHGFEPPFAFPNSGINTKIYVVDHSSDTQWSSVVSALPDSIREQISSSNMEYFQDDSVLYFLGGYGWKSSINNFVTFPILTAINLNKLVPAVMNNTSLQPCFTQVRDTFFAVTGGNLEKMDSTFYLVFGHRFDGRYDRTTISKTFKQKYSNQVRKFRVVNPTSTFSVNSQQSITDTVNFHRRDYNLIPQIFPDRSYGLTAFSGVFRYTALLPYLNTVDISSSGYSVNNAFNQNLSQYHCAVMSVYDSTYNAMHSIFFGGISLYTLDTMTNQLVPDTLVPFVKTISKVSRYSDGSMVEFKLPIEMPALLGTNAKFIPENNIPLYKQNIIHLKRLGDSTLVGYIVGGINTPDKNVGQSDASFSTASTYIFEVHLNKTGITNTKEFKVSNAIVDFLIYPNPANESATVEFNLLQSGKVVLELVDNKGVVKQRIIDEYKHAGTHTKSIDISMLAAGNYFCRISSGNCSKALRLVRGGK